jgi:phosphopantetheinyl transferase
VTVSSARLSIASESPLPLEAQDLHLWLCHRDAVADSTWFRRQVLSRYTPLAPVDWRFANGVNGKPRLVDSPRPLDFNLSDSGDWLACAVTAGSPVGVDLEYCESGRDLLKLARRFFMAHEVAVLEDCCESERVARFYDYWTLKEAAIKARGGALGPSLETTGFSLSLLPGNCGEIPVGDIAPYPPGENALAHYCLLRPMADYRLATCWLREEAVLPRLRLFQISGRPTAEMNSRPLMAVSSPVLEMTTGRWVSC